MAFAVLRLIANLNRVGRSKRQFPGLRPSENAIDEGRHVVEAFLVARAPPRAGLLRFGRRRAKARFCVFLLVGE